MRFGLIPILLLCIAAHAGPETQPSTAPAEPPASTPREALHSLNLAQRDGDAAALRSLFTASDEAGVRVINAMADYAVALVALHDAAEKTFGPDSANFITGDMKSESATALTAIDKCEVMIDHEAATVKYMGAADAPIRLVKVDGRWKLPVVQLLVGGDRATEEKVISELTLQARIARTMAEEITAGKFPEGANRTREVWRSRLLAPTTQQSAHANDDHPKSPLPDGKVK